MEKDFWLQRWQNNQIGWHRSEVHPLLNRHWPELGHAGGRVLVPLSGKSLDLRWLADRGHSVLGVELSAQAIEQFFAENSGQPEVQAWSHGRAYRHDSIRLLCGDFFNLQAADVGDVGIVYDRAALIAFPPEMRRAYAKQLSAILPTSCTLFQITIEYEQGRVQGPPFSVTADELAQLYPDWHIRFIERCPESEVGPRFREAGVTVYEALHILSR